MRKQGREGQGTARSASKSRKPVGEQTGEQTPDSTNQDVSMNQQNQGTSSNQKQTGQQAGGEQDLLQHAKQATGSRWLPGNNSSFTSAYVAGGHGVPPLQLTRTSQNEL